jgi:lipoprotein signal peptidase
MKATLMPERTYRWLLFGLAFLGLSLDQASKYAVFSWLSGVEGHSYVLFRSEKDGGGFQLVAQFEPQPDGTMVPHVNHGALFGFLRDRKTLANNGFAVVSLLAAGAIALWSRQRSTARDLRLCTALGLILGGTLGNLYDRLVFNGVRDFLHWNYLFDWPVFNIADCCLVLGAGLLLLQAFAAQTVADPEGQASSVQETAPTLLTGEVADVSCMGMSAARKA